jgi:hypothetical protein
MARAGVALPFHHLRVDLERERRVGVTHLRLNMIEASST